MIEWQKKKKPNVYVIAAIVVVAILTAAMLVFGWWQRRSGTALCIRRVVPLGGEQLAAWDRTERRGGRWVRIAVDGALGGTLSIEGRPIGWDTERLWTIVGSGQINAYRLPGLEPIDGLGVAISRHPALARGITPQGLGPAGELVVRGSDREFYGVHPSGTVARLEGDLRAARSWLEAGIRPLPSDPSQGERIGTDEPTSLPAAGAGAAGYRDREAAAGQPASLNPTSLRLIMPRILLDDARGEALALRDPPAFVVLSDDRTGASPSHLLSRVGPDGGIGWTVDAAALLGPTRVTGGVVRVLYAQARDDSLVVFVTRSEVTYQTERREQCDARIVVIDALDGQVRSRRELAPRP